MEAICERCQASTLGPGSSQFKKKPYREDTWMEKGWNQGKDSWPGGKNGTARNNSLHLESAKCPGQVPY